MANWIKKGNKLEMLQRHDLFGFIRFIMWMAVMYPLPLKNHLPPFLRFTWNIIEVILEIFLYFVAIHITILYACTLYLFYQQNADLESQVNCFIQLIIYSWTIAMKIHFRRISPKLLQDIMESINTEYRLRSASGLTYVTMAECIALSQKWIKIYVISCFSGTIFWLMLPIFYADRSLPLSCWYPFDYKKPVIYELMYFLQLIGQSQVSAAFSGSSGFYMILAVLISGQYDLLHCSLKNIIATSYIKLNVKPNKLHELEKVQKIANTEENQYFCAKEHKDDLMSLTPSLSTNKPKNIVQAFRASIRDCVQHHRYIRELLEKTEKFYNTIWLIKCGEIILLMCLVAFVSVKSTTANSSFLKIFSLAQYLSLVIIELFIICYFGEMIYGNSQRCDEALMRCPWYLHMREIKQDLVFFLMDSRRAFRLTAGKLYTLDINRFRTIMTTAFSFLTILQKMDQRN